MFPSWRFTAFERLQMLTAEYGAVIWHRSICHVLEKVVPRFKRQLGLMPRAWNWDLLTP